MKWEAQESSRTLTKTKIIEVDCPITIEEIHKYFLSCDFLRFIFPIYNNYFS